MNYLKALSLLSNIAGFRRSPPSWVEAYLLSACGYWVDRPASASR